MSEKKNRRHWSAAMKLKLVLESMSGDTKMAVELHEVLGQTLAHTGSVNALLLSACDKEIIFIDEVHELPTGSQTALIGQW